MYVNYSTDLRLLLRQTVCLLQIHVQTQLSVNVQVPTIIEKCVGGTDERKEGPNQCN